MTVGDGHGEAPARATPLWTLAPFVLLLVLRMLHLAAALRSPLTLELGPDEVYHLEFARALLAGRVGDPVLGFMDPLYPFLLAGLFRVTGENLAVLFAVQVVIDVGTAIGLVVLGRALGSRPAGIGAVWLYALSQTATLSVATVLKSTCVAAYLVWWCVLALRAVDARTRGPLVLLGLYTALGVALRGNFALLALLALVMVPLIRHRTTPSLRPVVASALCMAIGLLPILGLLAARNHALSGAWSPLPTNGGVVLHQLYNERNPTAVQYSPDWVSVPNPVENWRGYQREAEQRAGHALAPADVDRYWRGEALGYMATHVPEVAGNVLRKLGEFLAFRETPNNRSLVEEQEFSLVLRWLPPLFGVLAALGVPGLLLMIAKDRRALVPALPTAVVLFTFVVFFAEERYRFHAVPLFCLYAATAVEGGWRWWCDGRPRAVGVLAAASAALLAVSVAATAAMPVPAVGWYRIAKGHLRAGEHEQARTALARLREREGDSAHVLELLGWFAMTEQRHADAAGHYRAALLLRSDHATMNYNLALALLAAGDTRGAVDAARESQRLRPSADTMLLLAEAKERAGDDAGSEYRSVLADPGALSPAQVERARAGLARQEQPREDGARDVGAAPDGVH